MQSLRRPRAWRSPVAYGRLSKRPIDEDVMWSFLEPFFTLAEIRRDAAKVISAVGPQHHRHAANTLISEFDKPVVLAWGADDGVFPPEHAETYAAALANSSVKRIDDSYTYVAEDNPSGLSEALVSALAAAAVT